MNVIFVQILNMPYNTMKKKIKIIIIGCGKIAHHYIKIIRSKKINNFKLVGFFDIDINKASLFAKKFYSKAFTNLDKMLDETNSDLAIILSPSGLHYAHTKKVLKKKINVLVEKPAALIPSQVKELSILAKKKKLLYVVAFQNRLNLSIVCLKEAINKKRFGKIITSSINLRWCRFQKYYNDDWHGTWKHDGGVINQQALHHIDALNWLIGPVNSVCAKMSNQLNKLEAEDTTVAIMKLKNGGLCTLEATTAARPRDFEASISIVGEKGMVKIGGIALNKIETWEFLSKKKEDKFIPKKFSEKVKNGYGNSHPKLIQKTLNELRKNKKKSPISVSHVIESTKLIHALYSSEENKKWIHLRDMPISKRLGK